MPGVLVRVVLGGLWLLSAVLAVLLVIGGAPSGQTVLVVWLLVALGLVMLGCTVPLVTVERVFSADLNGLPDAVTAVLRDPRWSVTGQGRWTTVDDLPRRRTQRFNGVAVAVATEETLQPAGERTAYTLKVAFRLALASALLWPLIARRVEGGTRRNLEQLKQGLEPQPAKVDG